MSTRHKLPHYNPYSEFEQKIGPPKDVQYDGTDNNAERVRLISKDRTFFINLSKESKLIPEFLAQGDKHIPQNIDALLTITKKWCQQCPEPGNKCQVTINQYWASLSNNDAPCTHIKKECDIQGIKVGLPYYHK